MKKVMILVSLFMLFMVVCASASLAMYTPLSVTDKVKGDGSSFDPDAVGKHIEEKANEIVNLSKSGSAIYIAFALVIFVALLIAGLFSKRALKLAFIVLLVSFVGYLLLNYWIPIKDGLMAFLDWLFSQGKGS